MAEARFAPNGGFRRWLLASALLFPTAALADAAPPADSTPQVQEVVVTATRREQALSKVPISVTALTQKTLDVQGVKNFADLGALVPGVEFDENDNTISIRGISSKAGAGTTGIYLDDIPIQIRQVGTIPSNALPEVFDLERVEVLRGPQGTLFGAGSEGGTVRYITPQPNLDHYSAYGRAELSFTEHGDPSYEYGAAVGGPIIQDRLAYRASASYRRDGGYTDRIDYHTGEVIDPRDDWGDVKTLRLAVTAAPVDNLLITPSVMMQERYYNDYGQYWEAFSDPAKGVFHNGDPAQLWDRDKFILPSLKVDYDFGPVKLIADTAYFYHHDVSNYDASLYNLSFLQQFATDPLLTPTGPDIPGLYSYVADGQVTNKQDNFSQEIRLQSNSPDSRLTWTAGVFFAKDRQENTELMIDPQFDAINEAVFHRTGSFIWKRRGVHYGLIDGLYSYTGEFVTHDEQLAGFGEATYALTDKLKVTGGLRYSWTHFDFTNFQDGPYNMPGPSGGAGEHSEHPLTPKISVSYQATPDDMLYATAAKGYRVGGANAPVPLSFCKNALHQLGDVSIPESYDSDYVWSYEVGAKGRFWDRRISVAASAFYLDWENIQQNVYLSQCGFQYTANLGKAVSKGFDLQLDGHLTHHLVVNLDLGYTDARYTTTTQAGTTAAAPILVAEGDVLPAAPWTAAVQGATGRVSPSAARIGAVAEVPAWVVVV
jgi:outer membrane receptor protein involved in Fe transport